MMIDTIRLALRDAQDMVKDICECSHNKSEHGDVECTIRNCPCEQFKSAPLIVSIQSKKGKK